MESELRKILAEYGIETDSQLEAALQQCQIDVSLFVGSMERGKRSA